MGEMHRWERLNSETFSWRMKVPGGWLYRNTVEGAENGDVTGMMAFVPAPPRLVALRKAGKTQHAFVLADAVTVLSSHTEGTVDVYTRDSGRPLTVEGTPAEVAAALGLLGVS